MGAFTRLLVALLVPAAAGFRSWTSKSSSVQALRAGPWDRELHPGATDARYQQIVTAQKALMAPLAVKPGSPQESFMRALDYFMMDYAESSFEAGYDENKYTSIIGALLKNVGANMKSPYKFEPFHKVNPCSFLRALVRILRPIPYCDDSSTCLESSVPPAFKALRAPFDFYSWAQSFMNTLILWDESRTEGLVRTSYLLFCSFPPVPLRVSPEGPPFERESGS
jgi:hypothetical protein